MSLGVALESLEGRQLIRSLAEIEPTYTFKHNLVQQVAYESLLATDRRSLHRMVGEALEQIHEDAPPELAEMLASHFERAGDTAKAIAYSATAGEQAMRRFATAEAASLYLRAIELARESFDEEQLLHFYKQRGRALELRADYTIALSHYEELEALGRERRAPKLELAGIIGAASLQAVPTPLFDPVKGLANAERALALAKTIDDPAAQAKAYWLQMLVQNRTDAKAAIAAGEASLDIARRHALREQEAFTLNDIQSNYQVLGRSDRALHALEEARPIWQELDNLPMLADNLASTAMLHIILAEYDLGIERGRQAIAISERTGNLWGQSYGRVAIGLALFARDDLGPAIRECTRSIELSEQAGFVYPQTALRAGLSIAYLRAGDLSKAADLAARVRELEQLTPFPGQSNGDSALALVAIQAGDLDEAQRLLKGWGTSAEAVSPAMLDNFFVHAMAIWSYHLARGAFGRALEVVDELMREFAKFQWRPLQGQLLLTRARALLGLSRSAEAEAAFRASYDEMVHQGIDSGLWEVEAEWARVMVAEGKAREASRLLASAAAHVRAVAEGLSELGLADRFLGQAHVRRILDEAAASDERQVQ